MRSQKLRVIMLCLGVVMTLGLSHAAAQACDKVIAGGNAYGKFDCRSTGSCAGWCLYSCTCADVFPGFDCDQVLVEAGFTLGDAPQCIN